MALLFIDGFDAYGTAGNDISSVLEEVGWVLTYQVSVGVQESSDNGTGYGLSCNVASYHPGYWGRMAQYFPIRSGAVAGFRVKVTVGTFEHICAFGYNNLLGTVSDQILVASNGANGITVTDGNGNMIVASANNVFFENTWQYMEVQYGPDTASGTIVVRVDGVDIIDYTGAKTTTGNLPGSVNYFAFYADGAGALYVDDFYLEDLTGSAFNGFLGDVVVHDLLPNADAETNQFTQVGGTGAGHYTSVDETPPLGDSSCLTSNTTGQKEIFTLPTFPTDIVDVLAMGVNIIARKSSAGAATYNALMVSGGLEGDGSAIAPSTSYIGSQTLYTAPPGGGDWTLTTAQNATFGIEIAS